MGLAAVRSVTPRPRGHGAAPAISTQHAIVPQRPCCPAARFWSWGAVTARNCTTRQPGRGAAAPISIRPGLITQQLFCATTGCLLRADGAAGTPDLAP